MMRSTTLILLPALCVPSAARAASPVEILIGDAGRRDGDGSVLINLRFLNGSADPQSVSLPDRVEARIEQPGAACTLWLDRATETAADISIPAGGFARATYRLAGMPDLSLEGAAISIPAWDTRKIAMALRPTGQASQLAGVAGNQVSPQAQARAEAAQAAAPPPADRSWQRIPGQSVRLSADLCRLWAGH